MTLRIRAILKKRKDRTLPFARFSEIQEAPLDGHTASPRPWRVIQGPTGYAGILDRDGHTVMAPVRSGDAELIVAAINAHEGR